MTGRTIPEEAPREHYVHAPRCQPPGCPADFEGHALADRHGPGRVAAYYFIGVDEGAGSVFGKSMMIHEFVHDSRHFLGFPCH